ncbi:copper-binding protein [Aquirhabdus sp.]|uniref:copper-binding protein n=1 Tax=Aquirhabdus sp. TaxID=2824160 RepID=UPI00396CA10E
MNTLTLSILATLMMGTSLSTLAQSRMNDMDMSRMTSAKDAKVAHGVGIIRSIDDKSGMIVLNHQPIKELNWPAMSMGFKVADHKLLGGVKAGQQVNFELTSEGTKQIVTAISVAK